MKRLHVTALAGCATLAALGPALAGGYSRGTADTDIIFEEGNFNMRASVTIVMPQRGYETVTAPTPGGALAGLRTWAILRTVRMAITRRLMRFRARR